MLRRELLDAEPQRFGEFHLRLGCHGDQATVYRGAEVAARREQHVVAVVGGAGGHVGDDVGEGVVHEETFRVGTTAL